MEHSERHPLILASSSPRRAELLSAARIAFQVQPANVDETPRTAENPREYVIRLATEKAKVIAAIRSDSYVVLGADTIVVVENEMIGKPIDTDDARRMLRLLSGKWHEVMTGIALIAPKETRTDAAITRVRFAPLTDAEMDWYLASGEPADKAGAYAIQGLASRFIERIEGSYSNVVGLPVETLWRIAKEMGIDLATTGLSSSSEQSD